MIAFTAVSPWLAYWSNDEIIDIATITFSPTVMFWRFNNNTNEVSLVKEIELRDSYGVKFRTSSDGRYLLYIDLWDQLHLQDLNTGRDVNLTGDTLRASSGGFDFSPDQTRILFSASEITERPDYDIYLADLDILADIDWDAYEPIISVSPTIFRNVVSFSANSSQEEFTVEVFNLQGQLVWRSNNVKGKVIWDGKLLNGHTAESGVYYYTAITNNEIVSSGQLLRLR
jgi:hypothetical protein